MAYSHACASADEEEMQQLTVYIPLIYIHAKPEQSS